ncbi:MAG: LTA synthase family protein [Bacteroidota bacterium]
MQDFLKRLPIHVRFLLFNYVTGLFFFLIFRIILVATNPDKVSALPVTEKYSLIFNAFLMGLRFDTVISGYILTLPFLLLFIFSFVNKGSKIIDKSMLMLTGILYTISFMICSADIPYFKYYFSRFTTAAFNWADQKKFMLGMIFGESSYFLYSILFLILAAIYWTLLIKSGKVVFDRTERSKPGIKNSGLILNIVSFILLLPVIFLGIRGRLEQKSPIRVGTAYFSSYAFPNQLGLNPVFTFIRSYLDDNDGKTKELRLIDDKLALANTVSFLQSPGDSRFPIARLSACSGVPSGANVVLIIMESMSAEKMKRYGNKDNLTPRLDSLAGLSYCFDRFYSAGIHTYNGIFSTLYSFPALLRQHPMKNTRIPAMTGLPITLKSNGYSTVFFTTHDEQFDNMAGFMYSNGFEKVVSQKDYPPEWIKGATGVPDHILFEQSIPVLRNLHKMGKPFFSAMLTASDHGPYYIPESIPFKPHSQGMLKQIIEYADWSIGHFMKLASKEDWYDNTIFVFVADHGANLNPVYDMPLSFNHSPFLIYMPGKTQENKSFGCLAGQIDVFPTIMHLLNIPYINNTMGIDLFSSRRDFIYFCNDDKIGCLNEKYFYVYRTSGSESLYYYADNSTGDVITGNKQLSETMKNYAFSMMQTSQWLIKHDLTGQPGK